MVYVIGRPINGISINGLEYLLDENDKIIEFNDRDDCIKYITKNVTDSDPEDFLWEKEESEATTTCGICNKAIVLSDYDYQFDCGSCCYEKAKKEVG